MENYTERGWRQQEREEPESPPKIKEGSYPVFHEYIMRNGITGLRAYRMTVPRNPQHKEVDDELEE